MRNAIHPMSENSKIKELTLEDLLLAALASAHHAQRNNSIDEVRDLFDYCSRIPKEKLPPEVVRFLSRYKRPRGRQYSERQLSKNFYNDPNRMAAHIAAIYVATPVGDGVVAAGRDGGERQVFQDRHDLSHGLWR
jgi:hypothetical protein